MKKKKLIIIGMLFLGLGLSGLNAQEVITSGGGNASGNGGSASYSIGQVVYATNNGTNGSVAQGVQQPFEISIVTGIEEAKGITLQFLVYPNPTTGILILKIAGETEIQFIASLYDMNGKLLENKKIDSNETSIDLSHFVHGTYFLKVVRTKKTLSPEEIKTFKIIKT